MEMSKMDINLQIGSRLRDSRENLNLSRAEVAEVLDVTEEHYRKLENGITALSIDKMFILNERYGMDPAYLILGKSNHVEEFDLDYFVANSTKEERNEFVERVMKYVMKLLK